MAAKKKTNPKATKKPKLTKEKVPTTNVRKLTGTIDKYFENNDIAKLTNMLIVNAPREEELLVVLKDLWESIKRANNNPKSINLSVLFLFSAVTEFWTLQQDKKTRRVHKQEWLDGMIESRESDIRQVNELIESRKERLNLLKGKKKFDDLTPTKQRQYLKIKEEIIEDEIRIKKFVIDVKVYKGSKAYYNYDLTVNMKVMHDPTTQLLPKHDLIMKMLKEFNVAPTKFTSLSSESRSSVKTLNNQFAGLND